MIFKFWKKVQMECGMKKNRLLKIILLCFTAVSCTEQTEEKQDFDRTGKDMTIKVFFYDTQGQLDKEFQNWGDGANPDREGFAVWRDPDTEPFRCEIHTLEPSADDLEVLGHELYHCLRGNFH